MGTHPIFESDFDCLTVRKMLRREIVRLNRINKGALFICDLQEKFRPLIKHFDEVVYSTSTMLKFAEIMEYPIAATEQFARGLGPTVEELADARKYVLSDKTQFSMLTSEVEKFLENEKPSDIFLCGIEAHACIQGTAQDLIERGVNTFIVMDAVSASSDVNRFSAFREMEHIGCRLVTSEQVIIQTLSDAKHPKFKPAQKLLVDRPMKDSNLLKFL